MKEIRALLERIDWDFPRSGNLEKTIHSAHWFPGNSIPQIPAHLIQLLTEPGDLVFDPFVGSGTTVIEAVALGRRAIGSDRLPVSLEISGAKLSLITSPPPTECGEEILRVLSWDHECETEECGHNGEGSNTELQAWYGKRTLRQLKFLWKLLERSAAELRPAMWLVFSEVLYACASARGERTHTGGIRRHHWGWVADNVRPKELRERDALKLFREKWIALFSLIRPVACNEALLMRADARAVALPEESIDAIITSPPYVGMIDYTRANRMLYYWFNWDLEVDRKAEIGARSKRWGKNATEIYLKEMENALDEISRVLRPEKYCALVLGESRKYPGTAEVAFRLMEKRMPMVFGPRKRVASRKRVSDRSGSDNAEYVCVFKKL